MEKIDFGNLEANIEMLEKSGLLKKKKCLFEIGAGKGVLLNKLLKEGYRIAGNEVSSGFVDRARELFGKDLPIALTRGIDLPAKSGEIDLAISFDVLEHIPDTSGHLKEVKRILKKDGIYFFGVPNKLTNVPFEIFAHRSLCKYREWHCSLYTAWGICRVLHRAGFSDIKFHRSNFLTPFFIDKFSRHFGKKALLLFKILNPNWLPVWLRPTLYISARKK